MQDAEGVVAEGADSVKLYRLFSTAKAKRTVEWTAAAPSG